MIYRTLRRHLFKGGLRNNNDFTDVILACEDQSVKAHKVILSACSPFFKKLLSNNPHSHPLICKKGVSSSSLAAVTNFLYLGESSIFQEELDSFLALAKELQLRGLDGSCEVKEVKSRHRFMQPKGRQSLIKHNVFLRKRLQI